MGSGVSKIVKKLDPFTAKVVDPVLGESGLPNVTGNDGGRASAMADQAAEQAQAVRDQANQIAQSQRDAAQVQTAALRDQTAASVAAQVATINQQQAAAQLASAQAAQPQEGNPDVQLDGAGDSGDPRRKYTSGGSASIGGTSGGVGIRL
ncbi:hypothetical protein CAL26_21130 [Bordetella genomosp. 9]|uniref:Uncharacterized protein n=1 Tax=Bordetella genomosp. 9 TaxID=1416803 RepID=A0A261R651_9BORD|nr:hypothetical protein [Bordetella genomosp. 9]OZI20060.1 hypothetical protein CAL26_21130 [Bordetella genomosp. 9]